MCTIVRQNTPWQHHLSSRKFCKIVTGVGIHFTNIQRFIV